MRMVSAAMATLFALCVPLTPVAGAEENGPPSLGEICKTAECRPPGTFTLRTEKGEQELEQPGLPYVYEGQVIVLPGDEFDFEIAFGEDGKATLALPGDAPRPENTIHIEFSQMEGEEGMMMLSLRNNTAATVKYDAYVLLPDGRGGPTSSCPVRAGLSAFEMWPYPIKQLLLSNFRKLKEADGMVCQ